MRKTIALVPLRVDVSVESDFISNPMNSPDSACISNCQGGDTVVSFSLNGTDVSVDAPDGATLPRVLKEHLGMNGAKFGRGKSQCGMRICGSCSVLLDGVLAFSCQTRANSVAGRQDGLLQPSKACATLMSQALCRKPSLQNRRHNADTPCRV